MILVRVLQLVDNLRAIADVVIDSTSQVIYSFWWLLSPVPRAVATTDKLFFIVCVYFPLNVQASAPIPAPIPSKLLTFY